MSDIETKVDQLNRLYGESDFLVPRAAEIGKMVLGVLIDPSQDDTAVSLEMVRVVREGVGRFDPEQCKKDYNEIDGQRVLTNDQATWKLFLDAVKNGEMNMPGEFDKTKPAS